MRTILVPVDGTALAETALPHAAGLAQRAKASLHLVSVLESRPAWPQPLETYLRELAAREKAELSLARGNVAEEILNQAESVQADLIVMGTHGRRGLERLLLGSVADKVMRHAPCPVMLVRSPAPDVHYRRILVPLDGSPASEASLGPACWLARHDDSELRLLRVLDFPQPVPGNAVLPWLDVPRADLDEEGAAYVERQAERLRAMGYRAVGQCCHGPAEERILESQRDLIVMASQSAGRFFGSVTGRVAHRSSSPVLVLRGTGALMRQEPAENVGATSL